MTPDHEDELQQQLRATHQQTVEILKSTIERLEARAEQQRRERNQSLAAAQAQRAIRNPSLAQRFSRFLKEPRTWLEIAVLVALLLFANYVRQQFAATNENLAAMKMQIFRAANSAAAAKKSADLALFQVKNLNAADLRFTTGFAWDQSLLQGVWLNIDNSGRATATQINGVETVSIEEFPSRRKIQPDVALPLQSGTAKPAMPGQPPSFHKVYAVSGLEASVIRDITRLRKMVRLEGRYTWDDGFGDVVSKHFCWDVIASHFQAGDLDVAPSFSYGEFDCDSSQDQIEKAIREKQSLGAPQNADTK